MENAPTINIYGVEIPQALRGLIEKPPLLEGEDLDHFWMFFAAVVDEQKPKGILDWVSTIDVVTKAWEELRLKRSSVALIHGGMLNALMYFMSQMRPSPLGGHLKLATTSITNSTLAYFSADPREKAEVVARLAQHGIGLAELQAKAAELNGEPLQMFERMIAVRENGRRRLRKEAALREAKRPNCETDRRSRA